MKAMTRARLWAATSVLLFLPSLALGEAGEASPRSESTRATLREPAAPVEPSGDAEAPSSDSAENAQDAEDADEGAEGPKAGGGEGGLGREGTIDEEALRSASDEAGVGRVGTTDERALGSTSADDGVGSAGALDEEALESDAPVAPLRSPFSLYDFEIRTREEPWLLTDDELRDAGWEFRDQSFRRGSPLAGLAALTIGIPFHGVGHLLVGDNDSMFRLLISEVLALGVAGVGTIMRDAAPHRNGVWASGAGLQVAGLSAFAAGWVADVVGSFKGTTVPLPRNSADLQGMAVDLHYTVLFSNEVEVTSVGVVGFQWLGERFSLRPMFSFGPGEGYYRGDLLAEYRHPFWRGGQSHFTVWGEIGEEVFGGSGWGREVGLLGLGVSVDMGDLLEHTRGLVWKLNAGAGVQSFHYRAQQHRRFVPGNVRLMVPVETSIAMNLNRGLNVELGYRHRPDELAGTVTRFGGTLYQQFTVLPINRLGIAMRLEQGAYLRLWVGLRYFITTPKL